ncbi:hypothetical protein CQG66_001905 [Salmonella enterica subsp. enterica]|uniref:Uncharacterized protein n=2 Tax=Salmonella enterica I TaxID=59201 RepID=A0A710D849_SALTM|nr:MULTISPECIES: hypothetical protein [Enterobacteriaceae]EAA1779287.1 hypothetical protein [Salmonella enterica subsp. enterica]EDQ5132866.1 hypothetical protein [Salmonella enterica subsp. enterica serovar 4,[5],12:i:-]HCM2595563.1 hypothetical protein [Salmonella enterica subsp. enterica serovar Typhimurium var. monophasic 4,[5],12:i:-]EAA3336150.1 hypothetical protein [Salmonella enterica subsp. enterica]EAA3635215.1 hypothetical protein [Salmonella enterica subsp. enterica]
MKQYSELENNIKRFIVEHEKGISIDDIHHKFRMKDGQNRKMADYLIDNKKIILEMKSLFSDRVKNVNDKLNELVKTDSWLAKNWHGAIHLEELIKRHPDSKRFRNDIINFAYENIKTKVVKEANKQINATKDVLDLNDSIGGLILLNDNVFSHESNYLSDEILYLLGTKRYSSVEFVVYISKLIDKQVDVCVLLDSQSKNKNYIEWYMNNVFLLNWASFNKYAIKM